MFRVEFLAYSNTDEDGIWILVSAHHTHEEAEKAMDASIDWYKIPRAWWRVIEE